MRDLFFATIIAASFFMIAFLMSLARNLGIESIVAATIFFGFIAIIAGLVIHQLLIDYKLLHKSQK